MQKYGWSVKTGNKHLTVEKDVVNVFAYGMGKGLGDQRAEINLTFINFWQKHYQFVAADLN